MKQSRFIGLLSSQDWGTVSVGFGEMYFDLICSFLFLHPHSNLCSFLPLQISYHWATHPVLLSTAITLAFSLWNIKGSCRGGNPWGSEWATQDMPHRHVDYFERRLPGKRSVRGNDWKQQQKHSGPLPSPNCTLNPRDGILPMAGG